MITLIKTATLYNALNYAVDFCKQNSSEKVDIIVPDKLSLFMERNLFEKLHIFASFNISVYTLNRYAKRNLSVDKSAQISKLGSIILINKILNENANNLKVIVSKNYSFTYAQEIYKTIYQLKASRITAEEMMNFKSNNLQLENKIKDLALIYNEYEKSKAGLKDASDMFLLSAFKVAEGRVNHKILFVGFDDFTAVQYSLIEQLAINCDVSLVTYYSNCNNKYIYNDELKNQIKSIAYINEINYVEHNYNCNKPSLNQFLQENIFATNSNRFCMQQEDVKIISASSTAEEIEQVARDIKTKIYNGNSFANFGVAVYDLPTYAGKIEEIFNKYELNFYIDAPFNLAQSVFFKFLISIFKFNFESNNLCHVIDLISSPFFDLDCEEKQQLISVLTTIKFKGKSLKNIKFSEDLQDSVNKLNEFLQNFIINKADSVEILQKNLINALEKIDIENRLNIISQELELKYQILLNKSYESVLNLFDEVVKFYPTINAENFYQIFIHLSEVVEINNLPLTIDAVKVVDANNFCELFNNLYFINCTAANAPRLKNDCGIILDSEIDALNFAHKLAPTIAHINKLQKLRLYNSALLFEQSLTISYTLSQSELIKELLKKLTINLAGVEINLRPNKYVNNFTKYIALSKWDYIEASAKYNNLNNISNFTPLVKNNDNVSPKLSIFNFNSISASSLEHYFACPFYCFLNDFLKIRPRLDSEVLALDIGNILHEIVYLYYKNNKQVGDRNDFIKKNIDRLVDKEERLRINKNSPIILQLTNECNRILDGLDYIDSNCLFYPTYFELPFGYNSTFSLGAVNLVGKVDRIDIYKGAQGDEFRIIDYKTGNANANLSELYFGKKLQLFLYNLAMEQALKMQGVGSFYMPLHNKYEKGEKFNYSLQGFFVKEEEIIKALDKTLKAGNKSDIVNVSLYGNGNPYASEKLLKREDFSKLKQYAKIVSNQAVKEIKSGYIKPSPYKEACKYCPYVQACLKDANNTKTRGKLKVSLDSFKEEE